MPYGNDIWAPGFDGVVHSDEQTPYIPAGDSVWEFGTNKNSLRKVRDDYRKRSSNYQGIDKEKTSICHVTPKILCDSRKVNEWKSEHKEWKEVRIYDASVLCDWINSEPAVCAWLLEKYFSRDIYFSTLEMTWSRFSHKTSPHTSKSLFLSDRNIHRQSDLYFLQ